MSAEPQSRVQIAASHWRPRFVANGIDVNDFDIAASNQATAAGSFQMNQGGGPSAGRGFIALAAVIYVVHRIRGGTGGG